MSSISNIIFWRTQVVLSVALGLLLVLLGGAGAAHAVDATIVEARYLTMSPYRSVGALTAENRLKSYRDARGVAAGAPIDDGEAVRCVGKRQAFCRDLAETELRVTSLYFLLPEVRGLSPQRLNIRRNSVSATYSFR